MEWDEWFDELLMIAVSYSVGAQKAIQRAPFMYEDYFEDGLTPEEAFIEEWGDM